MKKLVYILAFLMASYHSFAQTKKVYITRSGDYTSNSKKGVGYLLVQPLTDSGYIASRYDMHNMLLAQGTYRDEELTSPVGRFSFYKKIPADDENIITTVANKEYGNEKSYKASTGNFVNGKRNGTWLDYSPNGDIKAEYTYDNDVLQGPCKIYTSYPDSYSIGNMTNGVLNGNLKWYYNGLLSAELNYKNGKVKSKAEYLKPAVERTSLRMYLERKMHGSAKVIYDSKLILKYTVNKEGKLTDAQIISGYTPDINKLVLNVIKEFDGYDPATYNHVAIDQQYTETINMFAIYNNPTRHVYLSTTGMHGGAAPISRAGNL